MLLPSSANKIRLYEKNKVYKSYSLACATTKSPSLVIITPFPSGGFSTVLKNERGIPVVLLTLG
jgi:hypothetical protein